MNLSELDTSFVLLPGSLPPDEALARLGDQTYAVVVDEAGTVLAVGTAAELSDGTPLPPAVVIPAELPLDAVLGGEGVTLLELNSYGAVVVEGGTVLGVLPVAVVDEAIATGEHVASRVMGDAALPGDVRVPVARVRCTCGFVNTITFYDPDRPNNCTNSELPGHPLVLGGR